MAPCAMTSVTSTSQSHRDFPQRTCCRDRTIGRRANIRTVVTCRSRNVRAPKDTRLKGSLPGFTQRFSVQLYFSEAAMTSTRRPSSRTAWGCRDFEDVLQGHGEVLCHTRNKTTTNSENDKGESTRDARLHGRDCLGHVRHGRHVAVARLYDHTFHSDPSNEVVQRRGRRRRTSCVSNRPNRLFVNLSLFSASLQQEQEVTLRRN